MSIFKKKSKNTAARPDNGAYQAPSVDAPAEGRFDSAPEYVKSIARDEDQVDRRRGSGLRPRRNRSLTMFVIWLVLLVLIGGWAYGVGLVMGRGDYFEAQARRDINEAFSLKGTDQTRPELSSFHKYLGGDQPEPSTGGAAGDTGDTASAGASARPSPSGQGDQSTQPHESRLKKAEEDVAAFLHLEPKTKPKPPAQPAPEARLEHVPQSQAPQTPEPRPSGKHYTVQVAAVATTDEAEEMVGHLKQMGYSDVRYYFHRAKGHAYYRVRVGHYQTYAQAETALKKLESQTGRNDLFVAVVNG